MEWISSSSSLSIRKQCELAGISRSSWYYEPVGESLENLQYMRIIDEQYMKTPFYGVPRMTATLRRMGYEVNTKRVERLMGLMGIRGISPHRQTTKKSAEHKTYPYLLRGLEIVRPNQVWSTDITYIGMSSGFLYLCAVIDWYSRYVLSWRLSNTMDVGFCLETLTDAFSSGYVPEIFNSDQGSQFTSQAFTGALLDKGIAISMDGKGRALDNIFVERLWRTVKYENIFINDYENGKALHSGMKQYWDFYNNERLHQSLGYATPKEIFEKGKILLKN